MQLNKENKLSDYVQTNALFGIPLLHTCERAVQRALCSANTTWAKSNTINYMGLQTTRQIALENPSINITFSSEDRIIHKQKQTQANICSLRMIALLNLKKKRTFYTSSIENPH